jgi:hypothetical protein
MWWVRAVGAAFVAVSVGGCITTSMQGYADLNPASHPLQHIVAYVAAPPALASSIQENIADEAKKRGIFAEDAFSVLPPTRQYTDAEMRQLLSQRNVDGVLIIQVGDSGVQKEYTGTILTGQYSGVSSGSGTVNTFGNMSSVSLSGTSTGTMTATSSSTYRYSRKTAFTARLIEPATARNLWVGNGQVDAGGLLFVGNGMSASSSVSAIFDDLQKKGVIGHVS